MVHGFNYTEATRELELWGNDLPANLSSLRYVKFAHSLCKVNESTLNGTGLKCVLEHDPVCGDHLPYLVAKKGLVNNTDTLIPLTINCSVNAAFPTTQLNLLGGDNLTISGTNLPFKLETSDVNITFNDS